MKVVDDVEDVFAHCLVAVAVGALSSYKLWLSNGDPEWFPHAVVAALTLTFLGRELIQRFKKSQPWTDIVKRPQVLTEWLAPSLLGAASTYTGAYLV